MSGAPGYSGLLGIRNPGLGRKARPGVWSNERESVIVKRLVQIAALCAIVVAAAAAPAAAADALKIRIATEGAYPPFNFKDPSGALKGFDVEIANALCAEMKADCSIVAQDWDGIIPALLAKKYDAIVASMSITEERKKAIAFSRPYYQTPAQFVAKKGAFADIKKETLKGKTIGVQSATIHFNYVNDHYKGSATIKSYDTQENANLDLMNGRLDAVLADKVVLLDGVIKAKGGENFAFFGPELKDTKWFGDGVGVGLRKQDKALKEKFDAAILTIRKNGTYDKIRKQYFDFEIWKD